MTAGYYSPGPDRSQRVRQLFRRIARRYDLINDLQSFGLHRFWKRKLVALAPRDSDTVLDVCCGTGDIAARFARTARIVVGCDFSAEMLAQASTRGSAAVQWVQADALSLPFPDQSFDLVTIGYGLRNLSDFQGGVAELLRVLKPGGRLLVLDFGKPNNVLMRAGYFAYLRLVVPLFGLIFCGDPAAYSYILDSLRHYPAQEGVTKLLHEAGCAEVRVVNFIFGAMSLHLAARPAFKQR